MIYRNDVTENNAVKQVAEFMAVTARTAPKACGVDVIETLVLDGADKDNLADVMREIGQDSDRPFFIRDAGNIDVCHCIVLIGAGVGPRGLNCALCGAENCIAAKEGGIANLV